MVVEKGVTPVQVARMRPFLSRYPDKAAARVLEEGFSNGFWIPSSAVRGSKEPGNLKSARQYPDVVKDKLAKEVSLGRMCGPFPEPPLDDLVVSPLGLVPKKELGKFRLIHHLSFPPGESVNDGIHPEECAVAYASIDAAIAWVRRYGKGALLAKADIEAAFRLLPVHPLCMRLLGCKWDGGYYVDRCLPMGCSVSCALFEKFSTFLEWVVRTVAEVDSVIHYLDDFLLIGPAESGVCRVLLATLQHVAETFGVPLAGEKTEGPTTVLTFLGIELDTVVMECRLPLAKLDGLRGDVSRALERRKMRLQEVQSLLGKLNFACRVIRMGRIFCRRLAAATAGVRAPSHFVRLSKEVKADLRVWEQFLVAFNGRALWLEGPVTAVDLELFTDAAGSTGFGAYFGGKWCAGAWPQSWVDAGLVRDLVVLELFPIVLAVDLWGRELANKKVRFHCDNLGVVQA
ncbi:uncharacterized protein, partial [Pyxicephalus adspersus]|uniref:uncharacterized protein n=1 Tax=Pyxicephalus adspersus TaxID=30357 RepID=UPI003B5C2734